MAEIGCNWARIGPSKSSQSLSIAHKWAVELIDGLCLTVFIVILLGLSRPIQMGFKIASNSILQFRLQFVADSSVLTLTLAFLDFGIDFAQSFPFHAQFLILAWCSVLFDDIHFLHNTNAKQTYIWQFLSVFGHLSSFLEMFEYNSYQAHDVHNDFYEALHKLLELDYSNQRLADQEEARKKRQKRRDVPRTPPGSPPS
ncbi:hypothetical protein Tco_0008362 [Tanacetum coccineum]